MESFDVIIVGGGPAGLACAEHLGRSGMKILLLEKDHRFGNKVCAGGITRKGLSLLRIPDAIVEQKIFRTALHSPRRTSHGALPEPIVVTVGRMEFGTFQKSLLSGTNVKVLAGMRVVEVTASTVVCAGGEVFGYHRLVGADGYASLVRRYLGLNVRRRLIGIQYIVPAKDIDPVLEIFLDSRHFHAWYGWIFPHRESLAIGCCCDTRYLPAAKLKKRFHRWLAEKGIDTGKAEYQSAPISYDYRGLRFGNIFLAGEAAGVASGLTGEGIYQSMVSGREVARYILGSDEVSDEMKFVLKYNRIQLRIMKFLVYAGPLRGIVHELIIMMMNNKRFKEKVNRGFS
jgi:geranylgeranyl reductase